MPTNVTYTATPVLNGNKVWGILTKWPPVTPDPSLNVFYNCQGYDSSHVIIGPVMGGNLVRGNIYELMLPAGVTYGGNLVLGTPLVDPTYVAGITMNGNMVFGDPWLVPIGDCWVWTSRIGAMDFTEGLDGEVTKRPMPWAGWTYAIKKLGKTSVIVYGKNGIARMKPNGVVWELDQIWPVGLIGKNACIDTAVGHYAIDAKGVLLKISEDGRIQAVDYSRWFSSLADTVVMSYDPINGIVYVSDGTLGFVLTASGLGKGPVNITGIGYKDETFYATATTTVTFDPFQIATDILDFGNRDEKTITQLDFGLNVSTALYGAVDYRWQKSQSFFSSPWVKADSYGRVFLEVKGIEFKIKAKLLVYEDIQLDYGNVHVEGVGGTA